MQSYKSIIAEDTTLVLSTDSDLFKFLKGMSPDGDVVPAQPTGDNQYNIGQIQSHDAELSESGLANDNQVSTSQSEMGPRRPRHGADSKEASK
jgi:hypothetical protein